MTSVALTAAAAERIAKVVAGEPAGAGLRVAVEGGGCSGFQYEIGVAQSANADDLVIERDGARLFVDPVSLPFLLGSEVDWVDELIGASFKVKNPNATSSCGCGVSFAV
jgi:iron-sulfur cluster assembly accessory protein